MPEYKNIGSVRNVLLTFIITTLAISTVFVGASAQIGLLSSTDFLGNEDISAAGAVPQKANLVARVDVEGLMNDETTQRIAQESSESFIESGKPLSDVVQRSTLGTVQQGSSDLVDTDIQVSDIGEMIVFGEAGIKGSLVGKNNYGATIIQIDATPEEVNQLFYNSRSNFTYNYQNNKVMENSNLGHVAVISENLYIVGQEDAVQDSIDVALNRKPSIDEDMIPNTSGDSYANMLLYRSNNLFEGFGSDQLQDIPIPKNISLTYSSTNDNTVRVDVTMRFSSETNFNMSRYIKESLSDYEKINVESEPNVKKISIEVAPENVENIDTEIKTIVGTRFER